jgi:hypothetical protein
VVVCPDLPVQISVLSVRLLAFVFFPGKIAKDIRLGIRRLQGRGDYRPLFGTRPLALLFIPRFVRLIDVL